MRCAIFRGVRTGRATSALSSAAGSCQHILTSPDVSQGPRGHPGSDSCCLPLRVRRTQIQEPSHAFTHKLIEAPKNMCHFGPSVHKCPRRSSNTKPKRWSASPAADIYALNDVTRKVMSLHRVFGVKGALMAGQRPNCTSVLTETGETLLQTTAGLSFNKQRGVQVLCSLQMPVWVRWVLRQAHWGRVHTSLS